MASTSEPVRDIPGTIAFDLVGDGIALSAAIDDFARKLGYVADLEASEEEKTAARIVASIRGDVEPHEDIVVQLQTVSGWIRVELYKRTIEALNAERARK